VPRHGPKGFGQIEIFEFDILGIFAVARFREFLLQTLHFLLKGGDFLLQGKYRFPFNDHSCAFGADLGERDLCLLREGFRRLWEVAVRKVFEDVAVQLVCLALAQC
jgi:hypothetical protein